MKPEKFIFYSMLQCSTINKEHRGIFMDLSVSNRFLPPLLTHLLWNPWDLAEGHLYHWDASTLHCFVVHYAVVKLASLHDNICITTTNHPCKMEVFKTEYQKVVSFEWYYFKDTAKGNTLNHRFDSFLRTLKLHISLIFNNCCPILNHFFLLARSLPCQLPACHLLTPDWPPRPLMTSLHWNLNIGVTMPQLWSGLLGLRCCWRGRGTWADREWICWCWDPAAALLLLLLHHPLSNLARIVTGARGARAVMSTVIPGHSPHLVRIVESLHRWPHLLLNMLELTFQILYFLVDVLQRSRRGQLLLWGGSSRTGFSHLWSCFPREPQLSNYCNNK